MHVSMSITKEQVDAMFRTMAETGKLVRITELDIKIGSASPSAEQLAQQSECYRMILASYFENVPVAQQSAVTMWTLSDNADEHKYWIPDDAPNIFDAKYGRKHAYKGRVRRHSRTRPQRRVREPRLLQTLTLNINAADIRNL